MRVLLIWPNSRNEVLGWGDLGAIAEPLALEYLAAGVSQDGHSVRILDLRLHPHLLEQTIREMQPDLVGVTAFSMHVRTALAICRVAKTLLPTCTTVVGGHHATLMPVDFFEAEVDYVVRGEGIRPLRTLLSAIDNGRVVTDVPGVCSRSGRGFVPGPPAAAFEIDALPFPDRSATAMDRGAYFIDWMKPVALIRTTVGCPFRCTFCSLWSIMDGKYRMRNVDAVVEELRGIPEDWVFLVDDEAFIHGPRMTRLASAIRDAGMRKRFFAYARIDSIARDEDVMRAWRSIGLERLFVGIDAISQGDLAEYNKHCRIDQIESGLAVAARLGIEIFAQFVVNPRATKRDFQHLVRFVEHHKIRYPSFTVLTPLPGTELLRTFEEVVERQPNGRPNWDLFDCQNAVTRTRLGADEFRREYRNLYHVFKGSYAQYREHSTLVDEAARTAVFLGNRNDPSRQESTTNGSAP